MNSNITKVNIEEINELAGKLNSISKTVNSNIKSYQKNLDSIEQAGYLKGVAEFAINNSCEKISSICSEFDDYARKLIKELNEVVSKTQQIETEEKGNIEEIISQDPTKFNGSNSSNNTATSNLSPMMKSIIEKMQSHMKTIKGSTGAITGSTITAAGIADALKAPIKEASAKIGTTATTSKMETNKTTQENSAAPTKKEPEKVETKTEPIKTEPIKTAPKKTGKAMDVPSGNTNYKSYTSYKAVNKSTPQGAVVYGTTSPYGKYAGTTYNTQTDPATGVRYVTFEGDDSKYYCAAMGTYYGEVGDTFSVTTDKGNSYNVIMCDAKGSDAQGRHNGGTWYHSSGNNKCLTEFYIDKNYIPDAMKVRGGTTGTYNSVPQFSGNITSITKLS